jgi:hypothetical protein
VIHRHGMDEQAALEVEAALETSLYETVRYAGPEPLTPSGTRGESLPTGVLDRDARTVDDRAGAPRLMAFGNGVGSVRWLHLGVSARPAIALHR